LKSGQIGHNHGTAGVQQQVWEIKLNAAPNRVTVQIQRVYRRFLTFDEFKILAAVVLFDGGWAG